MSFQAYLDKAEEKTGLTPRQLVDTRQTPCGLTQGDQPHQLNAGGSGVRVVAEASQVA